jgi:erythromycin esterase-like protein
VLERAVELVLDGDRGSIEPFSALDAVAAEARFAFVVEMDHFVHEKYAFRLACIRYLVSRGWTWFGEELDPRRGERVDRYIATGDEALLAPIDEPDWYTSGVLRQATARQPAAAFEAEQRRFAQAVRRCAPGARWFGFDIGGADADYLSAANAADTFDALQPVMALRERKMHERVRRVATDHPEAKIALMAGSLHLMKNDDAVRAPGGVGPGGTTDRSIGHVVANDLTDAPVLSMWMLNGTGTTANPWLEPPGRLLPAAGTLDAELAQRWDTPCFLSTSDDNAERDVTQMHNMVMTCRLADQVDGVVFVPRVTPIAV